MTRPLAAAAAAAAVAAVAAVLLAAARQGTPRHGLPDAPARSAAARSDPTAGAPRADSAGAARTASRFARTLLNCPRPAATRRVWTCGVLTDFDTAVDPAGPDGHVLVLLTATLHPIAFSKRGRAGDVAATGPALPAAPGLAEVAVPVTLRLRLVRAGAGWAVVEVVP